MTLPHRIERLWATPATVSPTHESIIVATWLTSDPADLPQISIETRRRGHPAIVREVVTLPGPVSIHAAHVLALAMLSRWSYVDALAAKGRAA